MRELERKEAERRGQLVQLAALRADCHRRQIGAEATTAKGAKLESALAAVGREAQALRLSLFNA